MQLSEKQMAKLDSLADETISVLSTTAVAGSVASAASLDGDLGILFIDLEVTDHEISV